MDPTPSSAKIDPPRDADIAPLTAPDRWTGVEDVLSRLAHRAARETPDPPTRTERADVSAAPPAAEPSVPAPSIVSAVPQAPEPGAPTVSDVSIAPQTAEPSVLATLRPGEFRNDPLRHEAPSSIGRVTRAASRFLIALGIGVAASVAWQTYGEAAREIIANRVPQLAWIASRSVTSQTPGSAAATGQAVSSPAIEATAAQPAVAQPAPAAQAATDLPHTLAAQAAPPVEAGANMATRTLPAAPSSDQQQLDAMARDIGALRQSVEQLVARQEQMTRDLAKLQATDASKHRTPAPPPRPAAARKPLPPQAAPQVTSSVSSALPAPPPVPPPPQISSQPPMAPVSPPPAATSTVEPPPLRPPAPVPQP